MNALKTAVSCRTGYVFAMALLLAGSGPINDKTPTLQDLQVAAHVLHFLDTPVPGDINLAIVFDPADAASRAEATALASLVGKGLSVGDLTLRSHLIEQGNLATAARYGAVFATIGVDQKLLGASLRQSHVPCLTRHLEQVQKGACIVAVSSDPTVRIVLNAENAAADDVRFATAFRMMVPEI